MIRNSLRVLPVLFLLLLSAASPASPPRLLGVTADGGNLRAELSDGRVLRGAELVGAVLPFQGAEIRVDAARRDEGLPEAKPGTAFDDVWLFRLSMRGPDGQWSESCDDGAQGMVYPGPSGAVRLTCSAGAVGTCIRYGYRPWAQTVGGVALAPYHRACVNLMRSAEAAHVEVYDRIGVQHPAAMPGAAFEAGWTTEGAVCLAHPRETNDPQAEVALAIMAIAGRADCTEEHAAELGALVFNRTR
ncbi:MAG: hypothetical protein JWR00_2667 [Rubritepida sp.]|nr:hypothetical protein [Rubritepida sp.]